MQALRVIWCANAKMVSKPAGELLGYDDFQKSPVQSNEDIASISKLWVT
jgi:hypothetical protein